MWRADLGVLALKRLGRELPLSVCEDLLRYTKGHPIYVVEILNYFHTLLMEEGPGQVTAYFFFGGSHLSAAPPVTGCYRQGAQPILR